LYSESACRVCFGTKTEKVRIISIGKTFGFMPFVFPDKVVAIDNVRRNYRNGSIFKKEDSTDKKFHWKEDSKTPYFVTRC
jgi:5-methylcytosine-specific restriction endonuclease McrBC GTP-binding regulatory subunit McrB